MSSIPANIILVWTGTHASIPSGWSRETTLDDKFAKAWSDSVAPNQIGGATTHTHTSPTHSHTPTAHNHTYTLSNIGDDYGSGQRGRIGPGSREHDHHHDSSTSGSSTGGTTGATAATYSAVSNNPPNRKVIFIKANAGAQLATDIVALWGTSNTPPSNWSNVTELQGRYLLGASTGADADLSTNGGSTSNAHTYNHSHTASAHTHAGAYSIYSNNYSNNGRANGSDANSVDVSHQHLVTLLSGTQNVTDYTGTPATQSETVEPSYRQLQAIKKGTYGLKEKGIIGMWLGGTGTGVIPAGWSLYTSMKDYHLKIGDPTASTGGANTHTHAAQGHTHTGSGTHTHTANNTDSHSNGANTDRSNQNEGLLVGGTHSHTVDNISYVTANYDSTNITADSSNNEPAYRTVAFLKFEKDVTGGGLLLFNMIT